jgi:MarR family transcriptional regulator, transcriptional regulator for hemolysin
MNFGEDLSLQVMLAHKSYQSYLNNLLKKTEVYQHYHILLLLSRMGGKSTQKVLGTELLIEKSNMVAIIDLLIDKGYVVRDINYKDRRSKLISLTPKGNDMVTKLNQSLAGVEEAIVEDITWQELYNCLRVLTKVNDKFKALLASDTGETED